MHKLREFLWIGIYKHIENVCLVDREGENYVFNTSCDSKKEGVKQVEQQ